MRNSRAFGQALVAAVACVAEDPPPPSGESHGLVPKACVVGQLVRPRQIDHGWMAATETRGGARVAHQLKSRAPRVGYVRAGWRGTTDRSRETLQVIQVALRAATPDRVRTAASTMKRDENQGSSSVFGNTPPVERGPPAPLTDSGRGDRP